MADLSELGVDLATLGFEAAEIDALLNAGAADPREEETPEPPAVPVSQPGDLWLLGRHRLLCGSATDPADVARLLGGVRPHLMATDPPYGVSYDPAWRNRAGASATKRTGKVLNDDRADWREAWALFPGEVAYVWHGALHATTVAESLERLRLRDPQPDHLGQGAAGALPRRLPLAARALLVRGREKGKGHWNGDRKQTTLWQIPSRDQDAATVHGTQKPVEACAGRCSTTARPGQPVYEPFSGSGTSIIAAETCGRISLSMELDPAYVDVAVDPLAGLHRRDRDPRRRRPQLRRDRARAGRRHEPRPPPEADGDPPPEGNRGKRAWNHDEPTPPDAHAALPRASGAGRQGRVAPGRAHAARAWGC